MILGEFLRVIALRCPCALRRSVRLPARVPCLSDAFLYRSVGVVSGKPVQKLVSRLHGFKHFGDQCVSSLVICGGTAVPARAGFLWKNVAGEGGGLERHTPLRGRPINLCMWVCLVWKEASKRMIQIRTSCRTIKAHPDGQIVTIEDHLGCLAVGPIGQSIPLVVTVGQLH
jgi:hypothetical protein